MNALAPCSSTGALHFIEENLSKESAKSLGHEKYEKHT